MFPTVEGGVTLLSGLKELFMPAASAYVTSYFLVFFVGALFGAVYQFTGAAESIAKWIAGMCKGKYVAPIVFIITCILTYGGVSGFVVFFVIYPIALNLFKEANLTRRLIPASISAGCWTVSMVAPGSRQSRMVSREIYFISGEVMPISPVSAIHSTGSVSGAPEPSIVMILLSAMAYISPLQEQK
jgi:H+/gluconate symporter-like permease